METKDKIRLRNFFIAYTNTYGNNIREGNYSLKYDYSSRETLQMIDSLIRTDRPKEYKLIERPTEYTFIDNLSKVLVDMDNDKVNDFFCNIVSFAKQEKESGLDVTDCRARIIQDENGLRFIIKVPDRNYETDFLHAAIAHEFAHFSLFLGKNRSDTYEYSEALSMFFEYMMYCSANGKELGNSRFENNRIYMLDDTFEDIKEDLFYALHPECLGIDPKYYKVPLAANLAYPESFEFTLQLIERREEDKKYVDDYIGSLLLGSASVEEMAYDLDIETKNYPKLTKLLK